VAKTIAQEAHGAQLMTYIKRYSLNRLNSPLIHKNARRLYDSRTFLESTRTGADMTTVQDVIAVAINEAQPNGSDAMKAAAKAAAKAFAAGEAAYDAEVNRPISEAKRTSPSKASPSKPRRK
jgi:hypothetical protein